MTTILNDFYKTTSYTLTENAVQASVSIDPAHAIFEGHFPGQPVVPGVCMIQIVKELLEKSTGKELLFSKGHQIKFLQLLVPSAEDEIQIAISWKTEEGNYPVNATFKKNDEAVFKLSGVFTQR